MSVVRFISFYYWEVVSGCTIKAKICTLADSGKGSGGTKILFILCMWYQASTVRPGFRSCDEQETWSLLSTVEWHPVCYVIVIVGNFFPYLPFFTLYRSYFVLVSFMSSFFMIAALDYHLLDQRNILLSKMIR